MTFRLKNRVHVNVTWINIHHNPQKWNSRGCARCKSIYGLGVMTTNYFDPFYVTSQNQKQPYTIWPFSSVWATLLAKNLCKLLQSCIHVGCWYSPWQQRTGWLVNVMKFPSYMLIIWLLQDRHSWLVRRTCLRDLRAWRSFALFYTTNNKQRLKKSG